MSDRNLAEKLMSLHARVARLKASPRRGWQRRRVERPESIADHVLGVAVLALVAARDRGLSVERAVVTALLHELCEAIVGDIIPADGVSAERKRELEEAATREVLGEIDDSGDLFDLWLDFEDERTPEGSLVKQLDRVEMALQAASYESESGGDLSEFHRSAREHVRHPDLVAVLDAIARGRS
jgi:5'-deoxynucleotidase YfbR-like HD superfamily hydrolase